MCTVVGCPNKVLAKGLCNKHYSRLRRHGRIDDSVGQIKSTDKLRSRYRYVHLKHNHPLGKAGQALPEHRLILWDKIGPGTHPCHHCGKLVTWHVNLHTDHLDYNSKNNAPENLVPCCSHCNHTNRYDRLTKQDTILVRSNGRRLRGITRNCEYCGKPFVTIPAEISYGKGRFCSKTCGYANRRDKTHKK